MRDALRSLQGEFQAAEEANVQRMKVKYQQMVKKEYSDLSDQLQGFLLDVVEITQGRATPRPVLCCGPAHDTVSLARHARHPVS